MGTSGRYTGASRREIEVLAANVGAHRYEIGTRRDEIAASGTMTAPWRAVARSCAGLHESLAARSGAPGLEQRPVALGRA